MKYFGFSSTLMQKIEKQFYDCFSIFCMSVLVTVILTMSVAKWFWNEPDKKKSASARQH